MALAAERVLVLAGLVLALILVEIVDHRCPTGRLGHHPSQCATACIFVCSLVADALQDQVLLDVRREDVVHALRYFSCSLIRCRRSSYQFAQNEAPSGKEMAYAESGLLARDTFETNMHPTLLLSSRQARVTKPRFNGQQFFPPKSQEMVSVKGKCYKTVSKLLEISPTHAERWTMLDSHQKNGVKSRQH